LYICDYLKSMIEIKENFGLLPYNTFRIDVKANYFVELKNEEEISELFQFDIFHKQNHLILGGGSNILFTKNFNGLIMHPVIKGMDLLDETDEEIVIKVGSGVVWDEFVEFAVKKDWGGIENLSNIPGNVGASPIQNIGAYGREVKNVIEKVEGIILSSGKSINFANSQCNFGYRTSIFKREFRNDILITRVTFRLKKQPHILITHYDPIENELLKYKTRNIDTIRKIICDVRGLKLPKVEEIGNAGSFFKNPVIPVDMAEKLKSIHSGIPIYRVDDKVAKLSAAWLIEKAGCKGLRQGNAGTYDKQALVLINLGNALGEEIVALGKFIQQNVFNEFGVSLEAEVNIV
jgi:UDP-N-acetylmuramate dehydrogenase